LHSWSHSKKVPPAQRQHALQSPVRSHWQQIGVSSQGQRVGHKVVTPSQVTRPLWPASQLRSTAVQLVVLLLPSQDTVLPGSQFAVAVQRAFNRPLLGPFAANSTPFWGAGQEPVPAAGLRIAARASSESRAWLGVSANPATETKRRAHATIHAFFMSFSSCFD
jgi:hypothetical protein